MSVQKLEWQVPAEDPDSQYMIIFNPHAWEVEGNRLENEFLNVHFSSEGTIGIFDKENGKEVFSGGEKGCRAINGQEFSGTAK